MSPHNKQPLNHFFCACLYLLTQPIGTSKKLATTDSFRSMRSEIPVRRTTMRSQYEVGQSIRSVPVDELQALASMVDLSSEEMNTAVFDSIGVSLSTTV